MKAAFLIRCSTRKQDYQRQVNDLTRLAKRLGYEYGEEITYGEHITGKDNATIRDRESVARLKADAIAGKFDVVLVSEVSRMSRDVQSGTQYVRELTNIQIPIYFKDIDTWTIDPISHRPTPNAEEVIVNAFLAAWKYLKSMKTQIASGRRNELDNNCISVGKPFFGYRRFGGKDKATKNSLVVDEVAAKVVVDVFNEYLKDGATLKSTALAITAKYGEELGRKFSIGAIEHILMYESYATGVKRFTLKDPDTLEVDEFDISLPIIISKEVYEAATAKRKANKVSGEPYPKQTTYLLSRLIKCPCCGYTLTPRAKGNESKAVAELGKYRMINGKKAMSWICMSGVNNATDCSNRMSIGNEKIEPIIWELVKQELIPFSNINNEDRKQKLAELEEKKKEIEANIGYFTADIESQKALIDRAYKLALNAPAAIAERAMQDYHNTTSKADKEIRQNESKIEGLRAEIDKINTRITFYSQPSLPEDIIERAEADGDLMRKLVKELIEKIIPYKISTYKVKERYGDNYKTLNFGVVLLEVHAINGVYYVFYNTNERGTTRYAFYMPSVLAVFQKSEFRIELYGESEEFYLPMPNMVKDSDELEEIVSINEFVDICKANNNIISYKYGA